MNKIVDKLEKVFYGVLKFLYYYTFVVSILFLICYYLDINFMLNILSSLLFIDVIVKCFKGEFYYFILLIVFFLAQGETAWVILSKINIAIFIIQNLFWRFISFLIRKFN